MKSNQIEIINNEAAKVGKRYIDLEVLGTLMAEKHELADYADAIDKLVYALVKLEALSDRKGLFAHNAFEIEKLEVLKQHLLELDITKNM
jgi:hypothetical protein